MASIRKRKSRSGDVSYHVQVRLKGFPPQTASFERLTDARNWASATESAIREGRHFKTVEAKKHTLADLVDRYAELIVPKKKNGRNDLRHLKYWKSQLGAYTLSDVTPALIVEARDELRSSGRSDSTANRYMTSLSHALTVATNEWGWLESNPCRKIKKLKEPRGRVRFLSDAERSRLLDVCRSRRNADLYHAVVFSLSTGARQGEILGMTWGQVSLERQVITLTETKNDEIRLLPLSGLALEIMQERAKIRRIDTTLVFPSSRDPSKPKDMKRQFEEALKKAEIEDFRWHDLRHTAASYLAMNGASLAEIAEVLGHKTLAMVKRYAHLSEAHTAKVVESLNNRMFGEADAG